MKNKLLRIFLETFPDAKFNENDFENLEVNSITDWDSIGNLNLLVNIESSFNIKFSSMELSEIKSIKAILEFLNKNN